MNDRSMVPSTRRTFVPNLWQIQHYETALSLEDARNRARRTIGTWRAATIIEARHSGPLRAKGKAGGQGFAFSVFPTRSISRLVLPAVSVHGTIADAAGRTSIDARLSLSIEGLLGSMLSGASSMFILAGITRSLVSGSQLTMLSRVEIIWLLISLGTVVSLGRQIRAAQGMLAADKVGMLIEEVFEATRIS